MKQSIIFAALGLAALGAAAQETGTVISVVQNRTVGYHVTYEYNGRHYTTQLPYDPGDRMRVRVAVAPAL